MFTFPNLHNKEKHVWEQELQIDDFLLPRKRTTSKTSSKVQHFAKYVRKLFLLKVETTNELQTRTAQEEEILVAGDVQK